MTPMHIREILSAPVRLGPLRTANRMVMGPMAANAPDVDGGPSEQTAAFFEARARGGVGLIIVGGAIASARGLAEAPFRPLLRFDIDDPVPRFRALADRVHAHGVPIIAELMPGFGRMGVPAPDRPLISASPMNVVIRRDRFPQGIHVPADRATPMPREASIAEIRDYEDAMIAASVRVEKSGWDGVEVAAHMSYFLASFLSPRTNWRMDEYGGSEENRARMLVRIVAGIRRKTGPGFAVGLRITANDLMPDGQGTEAFASLARHVAAAGLDYVALSTGCYESMDGSTPAVDGGQIDSGDAAIFRKMLDIPIMVQGLHAPARAAQAIAQGHGDLVMLARPLLADPDYAAKVAAGRPETITACNRDNLCIRRMVMGMPVRCAVNPAMGRESRATGTLPPLARLVKRPLEECALGLAGSSPFINLMGAMMNRSGRS